MRDDSASKLGQSLHRLGHQGDMRDDSTSKLPLSLGKKEKKKGRKKMLNTNTRKQYIAGVLNLFV